MGEDNVRPADRLSEQEFHGAAIDLAGDGVGGPANRPPSRPDGAGEKRTTGAAANASAQPSARAAIFPRRDMAEHDTRTD